MDTHFAHKVNKKKQTSQIIGRIFKRFLLIGQIFTLTAPHLSRNVFPCGRSSEPRQRVRSASPPRAYCPYPLFAFASAREGLEVHNLLIRELPAYLEYTGDTGLRAGEISTCVRGF